MFEMSKELFYCYVLKCMNSLKRVLPLALTRKLIIVQDMDGASRVLVLQYFMALQETTIHAPQLEHRWMCIPCAVFRSVLKPIQNSKEKRRFTSVAKNVR